MEPNTNSDEARWRGRPALSAAIRAFVFLAPVGAAVGASAVVAGILGNPRSGAELAWHLAIILGSSTLVLVGTDRLARRLMPLAVLLRLSLAFPKEAPNRLRIARRAASTRDLEERVLRARVDGVVDEPVRAAEQILELIAAVESHDRATRGHSERVRLYTDMLAGQLALPPRDRDRLRWAAMLHDVGKLEVPSKVLNKPSKLTNHEWEHIRGHPDAGARLIAPLREWLGPWAAAVEEHHERYDGAGYPRGISGSDISLGGRIVAVTDSYETMTAHRPYRRARSSAKARAELVRCSATHFDPTIVRAFLEISIRRLTLVSGPLSWLAQTPLLNGVQQIAGAAGRAGSSAAVGGALALTLGPVVPPHGGAPTHARPAVRHAAEIRTPVTPPPSAFVAESISPSASPTRDPKIDPSDDPSPSPTTSWKPAPIPTPTPTRRPDVKATPSPSPSEDPAAETLATDRTID